MSKTTITINGRLYDAITGMPVNKPQSLTQSNLASLHSTAKQPQPASNIFSDVSKTTQMHNAVKRPAHVSTAHSVHASPQRSQTLNRQAIKKPTPINSHTRSPLIRHFDKANIQPVTAQPQQAPQIPPSSPPPDHLIPPQTSPLHAKLAPANNNKAAYLSGKQLKEQLIKERLAEATPPAKAKKSFFMRKPRLASILASTLSLLILAGYFTYLNLSNISMQIASSKAGISARFPNYQPSGFSLSGPITYAPGEVNINYKSNSNDNGFTLTQKAADWDSQAVLDNYVRKQSSTYLTFQERGITIYTFSNKAAWSNGGMLYTLDGNASLSSDQILRLASSL